MGHSLETGKDHSFSENLVRTLVPAVLATLGLVQQGCASGVSSVYGAPPPKYEPAPVPNCEGNCPDQEAQSSDSQGFGDPNLFQWMQEHCVQQSTHLEGRVYSGSYACDDGSTKIVEKICDSNWVTHKGQQPECRPGGTRNVFTVQ